MVHCIFKLRRSHFLYLVLIRLALSLHLNLHFSISIYFVQKTITIQ